MSYKSLWKIIYLGEDRQSEYVLYYRAESRTQAVNLFVRDVGLDNFICDVFIADDDEVEAYEQGFAAGGDWETQKAYENGKAKILKGMLDMLGETTVPWKRKLIIKLIERVSQENE